MSRPWWKRLLCSAGLHGPYIRGFEPGRPAGHELLNTPMGGTYFQYTQAIPPRWITRCEWCGEIIDSKEPSAR